MSKNVSTNELLRRLAFDIRTSATRPNIMGYVPHDKQVLFHTSDARGKLFIGGNRSGKTVGGATEAIWWLTGRHPYRNLKRPPLFGRCVSVDFLNGVEKTVRPEIARWLPKSELLGGSWESAYDKELRILSFENGSKLEFMSYDQILEKFSGTSRDFIWFDEEPPKDIWEECILRLLDVGGSWWITMTPVEGMTWTYDDIYEKEKTDPNLFVIEVDTLMNPHLNPGEVDILLSGLDADGIKARLHGQYVQRGGLIYPMYNEEIHVIKALDPKSLDPAKWLHFAGMDHGFNNPTAWGWGAVDEDGRMVVYKEHYKSGWIVQNHARYVLETERQMGIEPAYRVGDPSIRNVDPITGTSVQLEYIENNVNIMLGVNDVKAGIDNVARRLGQPPNAKPTLYITQNCEMLRWEMKRYRWSLWANKKMDREKNKKEEPNKKDDHACDMLRYMCASRPMVEDHSIPRENFVRGDASVASSPYRGLVDAGVTALEPSGVTDSHLGGDF